MRSSTLFLPILLHVFKCFPIQNRFLFCFLWYQMTLHLFKWVHPCSLLLYRSIYILINNNIFVIYSECIIECQAVGVVAVQFEQERVRAQQCGEPEMCLLCFWLIYQFPDGILLVCCKILIIIHIKLYYVIYLQF